MEHYTKKNRVYITSKSYLKRMQFACLTIAGMAVVAGALVLLGMGVTFTSLGILVGLGAITLLFIRSLWINARAVSLKAGNLILKSMNDRNVVAPLGSIRKVKSSALLGWQFTRIRYHLDGALSRFFFITKSTDITPEQLIKAEIKISREKKKEANRKPDSVLTQIA